VPSADWYVALLDKDTAFSMLSEFRTSALIAMVIAVVIIIALLGMLIRVLMQPLLTMGRAMHDIAEGEGDLTKRLTIHGHDEFGALGLSFNRFVERFTPRSAKCPRPPARSTKSRCVWSRLELVDVQLRPASQPHQQRGRGDQPARRRRPGNRPERRLASQHPAMRAAWPKTASRWWIKPSRDAAAVGKISDSCGNIETLNSNTVNIGQILEVITSISQQTNLLALNAAIEAARAGEAGRGFAVVADEVRNLAHRTQDSAQQVQKMIEELQVGARQAVSTMTESQRHSESSVGIANQAGERLGSVTQRIGEIDGMNQSVATATEEQTAVVESINVDITEINTLNQEGVENLQATLRACSDLEQQAARLKHLVGSFRI
jgi:methyl-accepting chemotaxis protein